MNYIVKVYNRHTGGLVSTHEFRNLEEAEKYFFATGTGEGYWTELLEVTYKNLANSYYLEEVA